MKRSRIAGLLTTAFLVAGLTAGAGGAAAASPYIQACPNADTVPGAASNAVLADTVACLINAVRAENGISGTLVPSASLVAAERSHVGDMLSNRFLGHRGSDGSLPALRARRAGYLRRYKSFTVGENLGWGQSTAGTPQSLVGAWLTSPTHRRNILDPRFRQIGVVVETGAPVGTPGSAFPAGAVTYGITLGVVRKRR